MTNQIYALLVGIDRYTSPIPALQGCANDINAIETYLHRTAREWTLQPPKKLIDEQATRQAIIDGFQQYLTQAGEGDIALFYYSGHGGQEPAPPELRHLEPDGLNETLVCYDSRTSGSHDLADKELRYLLSQVAEKNPRVVVILDCCHSGSGTRNVPPGVRLAPQDVRKRELDSFIFARDASFKNLPLSSQVDRKKTGIDLPKGRHILLAACRDYQYAHEHLGEDGVPRGAFSYFLLKSLEQTNGNLSYLDLARNIEALVRGNKQAQVPQLEAANPEDLAELFLGNAIAESPYYFTLSCDRLRSSRTWSIDGGVLQGIPKPASTDETTLLAIFPAGSEPEDLTPSQILAEAKVTKVLTQKSTVEITQGLDDLDPNRSYWAVVTSLPLEPLKVYFEAESGIETGIVLAREAMESNLGQNLYLQQVGNATEADLRLLVRDGQYWIIQDERPLVAPIPQRPGYSRAAATEAIQALEAIARWRNILNLKSPQRSRIKSQDVEMQLKLVGYQGEDDEITDTDDNSDINTAAELRLEYKYENGEWKKPVVQIDLLNHSSLGLYANVIDLAEDYSVAPILYEDGIEVLGSAVLPVKTTQEPGIFHNDPITLSIPDKFLAQGITEYQDVLKLIVSKTDFNASLLQQDGLEPPNRGRRGAAPSSSLDRLMDRIYSRNVAPAARSDEDWITKEVAVTIVKPRDAEQLRSNNRLVLNNLLEIQPHPTLQAKVALTSISQTTRDIGNLTAPPALWDKAGIIEPWQFTTSRGSDPGLSALELLEVNDVSAVTKDAPLTILVNQTLAADEYLLPVSYDGEFFLPLGYGIKQEDKIKIELERLPQPTASSRSLGGSIKIFFKKLRHLKLGHIYEYPSLATAEVRAENNNFKVIYEPDREKIKQQVANAKNILLYIHGIIGDTESLVTSIQQAKIEIDGQQRPLREAYDLVLTFDYENLHTPIEENARSLKTRLEAVGLGANHGKQLQIIAHSMGGLVSRWFIEREGGNKIVRHLIMLGTPNAGSPWSTVQDMSFALLGMGLNQISGLVLPAKIVTDLAVKSLQFVENIDNALDQMQPDSEFIKAIALNPDPQVPYTIIAGDRSTFIRPQSSRLRRLMNKLFTPAINRVIDGLVFGDEPNDIAVSLTSIKSVSRDRYPQPKILPNVACDHMTYFTTEAGLQALTDALIQ